jgi:hypothetical protein
LVGKSRSPRAVMSCTASNMRASTCMGGVGSLGIASGCLHVRVYVRHGLKHAGMSLHRSGRGRIGNSVCVCTSL